MLRLRTAIYDQKSYLVARKVLPVEQRHNVIGKRPVGLTKNVKQLHRGS